MMEHLGVTWKAQPVDRTLRASIVDWIKHEVQPSIDWLPATHEMRSFSNDINDLYSFAKELLAGDTHSFIAMTTRENRHFSVPGKAPDGGWCLRDALLKMCTRIMTTSARINRILKPKGDIQCRYGDDGRALSVEELVEMVEVEDSKGDSGGELKRQELMRALALRLWETHQRGYVAYHLQSKQYRAFELLDWVKELAGEKAEGSEWILDQFPRPTATGVSTTEVDHGKLVEEDINGGGDEQHLSRLSVLRRVAQMIKAWAGRQ